MGEKPEIHTSSRYLVNPVRCSNGTVWSVNSESSNSMERANSPEVQDESTKLIRVYSSFKDEFVSEDKFFRPNTGNNIIVCAENKNVQI